MLPEIVLPSTKLSDPRISRPATLALLIAVDPSAPNPIVLLITRLLAAQQHTHATGITADNITDRLSYFIVTLPHQHINTQIRVTQSRVTRDRRSDIITIDYVVGNVIEIDTARLITQITFRAALVTPPIVL